MHASSAERRQWRLAALASAIGLALVTTTAQSAVTQSAERKNMQRLGHTDLQGRPTYQPNVIQYPNGKWYLFVGQHSGNPRGLIGGCPNNTLPNPLNGGACENNGTMIIDVTDPTAPVEISLIPSPTGGQSQMTRMCRASQLPNAPKTTPEQVYLLRNVQGGPSAGYEVWNVTDPAHPVMTSELRHIRSTHKDWWECDTGIMYAPGSKDATLTSALWRESQAMLIYDWSNPNAPPNYIRTFGLPGGQPNADPNSPIPNSLHGAISTEEHPLKGQPLARGAGPNDVIGNRIYAAWGVGDDGVMTIIDRKKLLPPPWGTWAPKKTDSADNPDEDELYGPTSPVVGYYTMSPDEGGHTSMPVFGLKPPSFQKFNEFATRDIVLLASEATADGVNGRCNEPPHAAYIVDVTVENSMNAPPGTRKEHDIYQGPMGMSTMWLDPTFGERYPRGNYCARGARFGTHSTEENFRNPLYGKLTAVAYFNGGLRIFDIREPYTPRQVAFYVPEANANTDPDGYMTNNVEIDNRGNLYIVDRNGAGMDILQLTGCATQIVTSNGSCPAIQ
ncbi:MAG TPA: hypothetical protein VGR63_03315 [Casimicrobiaceae bacterium]|jgi:hypothetical protein|nr:hypothetical protein [Casimicrobiaceae bacterium]